MGKKSGKQIDAQNLTSKKMRSAAYPLLPLPQAVEAAKKIYDNLGQGPHSRESLARGLGYASFSGAASGKIGALVHFGLLSRLSGRYSLTGRAKAIFKYPGEDCAADIAAAAIQPALYRALVARFAGDVLPNNLEAVLAADYGITRKAARIAVANFVETMAFSGMVKDDRLVIPETVGAAQDYKPQDVLKDEFYEQKRESFAAPEKEKGIRIKFLSGMEIIFPDGLAYRLSMGEFADDLKNLEKKAGGVE